MSFPAPKTQPGVGHLGRWGRGPLPLLEEGAALGPVFRLRLWRPTVVGYSPDWNRFALGNVATFRSKGSMSGLSPYLGAGVVRTDEPEHRPRRRELNPHFTHRSVQISDRASPTSRYGGSPVGRSMLLRGQPRPSGRSSPQPFSGDCSNPAVSPIPAPTRPRVAGTAAAPAVAVSSDEPRTGPRRGGEHRRCPVVRRAASGSGCCSLPTRPSPSPALSTRSNCRAALASRGLIGQAKGMLMQRLIQCRGSLRPAGSLVSGGEHQAT